MSRLNKQIRQLSGIDWLLFATFVLVTWYLWSNVVGAWWAILVALVAFGLAVLLPNSTQNLRQPRRVAMWGFVASGVTGTFLTIFIGRLYGIGFALILLVVTLAQVIPMMRAGRHDPK